RFWTTQVVWHRYPNSLRPPDLTEDSKAGGAPAPAPAPIGAFAGVKGEGPRPIMPKGPLGMPMPAGLPEGAVGGSSDNEANVELVLYGIVSLYERYPPRPVTAAAPAEAPKNRSAPPPSRPEPGEPRRCVDVSRLPAARGFHDGQEELRHQTIHAPKGGAGRPGGGRGPRGPAAHRRHPWRPERQIAS